MGYETEIRTSFEVDDEALSRLHALAFDGEYRGVLPWSDRLRRHGVTWAGAFHRQVLVGFVHLVWDGGLHGFLLDTVVHPDHQRHGWVSRSCKLWSRRHVQQAANGYTSTMNRSWSRSTSRAASEPQQLGFGAWCESDSPDHRRHAGGLPGSNSRVEARLTYRR